jgi:Domain of unknown function (DUF4249)
MLNKLFFSFCLLLLIASCSKDYDIQLPANKSALAVECYLEDGQPMRVLISETTALLDTNLTPPIFIQATVIITHGNVKDTLKPMTFIDIAQKRVFNYGSNKIVKADFTGKETYRIDVYDTKGRHAYGTTHFIKPVEIESLTPVFNNENKAFCLTKFKDDPSVKNYFRLVLNKNTFTDSSEMDIVLDNSFANSSNEYVYGSGYSFKKGDVINARVFHLTYDYYLYLTTLQNAQSALVNPFAVSGEVVSNIKGGVGVFAALSYATKSVTVK